MIDKRSVADARVKAARPIVAGALVGLSAAAAALSRLVAHREQNVVATILAAVAILAGIAVVALLIAGVWGTLLRRAERRLAERVPTATIVRVAKNASLAKAIGMEESDVSEMLMLVGTSDGLGLWQGLLRTSEVWSVPWADVTNIGIDIADMGVHLHECLEIRVTAPDPTTVRLVLIGDGWFGGKPRSGAALSEVVSTLEHRRETERP